MTGPLAGIRILTFTQAWAGTSATELLGLLGAEVIQIESITHPDIWRGGKHAAIPDKIRSDERDQHPWNTSAAYNSVNLNKRAITLDVTTPDGLAIFKRLVPLADVIADNFTPQVMRKWGLDFETLSELRPGIIMASLSAYGATGPLQETRGIGGTMEPMSGLTSLLGYEDGVPLNSGSMIPDPIAGLWFAATIIAALRHRNRTGEGQYIDLGMMESNAMLTGDAVLEYTVNGTVRGPRGNRHPQAAPHNYYLAADGEWVSIAAHNDAQWAALRSFTASPELADPVLDSLEGRKARESELDIAVAGWAQTLPSGEIVAGLTAAGVPSSEVRKAGELLDQPQWAARGFVAEVEHPEVGPHRTLGAPWRMSATQPEVSRYAPRLGEHTAEVLAEELGMTQAEYEHLEERGITGRMPA